MRNINTENLKPMLMGKLKELIADNPDMSMMEIMYTIFRKSNLTNKPERAKTGWMLGTETDEGNVVKITDREFYTAINNALNDSQDEQPTDK